MAIDFAQLLQDYGTLETIAGTAQVTGGGVNGWHESMEGGLAISAELSRPHMAMADWLGNVYIADKDAHAIRVVRPDNSIFTLAGTNLPGYNGDGFGSEVQLFEPNGLYTFPNGVTYVLDLGNSLIRRIGLDGNVATVVEDPFGMIAGRGLWVSPDEQLIYYSSGSEVRRWTPAEGVTTYAGGFVELGNLAIDPSDGTVVVTDRAGHGVYKLLDGDSRILIAGNEQTSGGGSGFLAKQTGLEEVRGIDFHPQGGYLLATHEGSQVWFVDDDQVIHLLVDGNDNGVHAGDGLPLSTPGRKISETRAVVFAPNGDILITEHDGGFIRRANILDPWRMGDFDRNGILDTIDIDLLTQVAQEQTHWQTLDLNFDEAVDGRDRQVWVEQLRGTYFGDANLDGEFNSRDFVAVFQMGQYEDGIAHNSHWAGGDWNGDGEFDTRDFVTAFQAGGYEQGPRAATHGTLATGVPEPSGLGLWATACWWLGGRRRAAR